MMKAIMKVSVLLFMITRFYSHILHICFDNSDKKSVHIASSINGCFQLCFSVYSCSHVCGAH